VTEHIGTIGRYTVLQPLEVGERDAVYLAEDPILMRQVAIKIVRGGAEEKGRARGRFRRAAEVAGALKHPNIVRVLDVGEDPVAGPFIVMEFVDGTSLADIADVGFLDVEGRLRWLLQVMRGLEAAHDLGIVHGNVNLSKVLVSRARTAKLMGFTPAADLAEAGSDGNSLSITIAPELHAGAGASAAADRYTFAVMALELMNEDWMQVRQASSADVGKVRADPLDARVGMQAPLARVFERALAKDPAERFVDLESFLRALIDASPLDVSVRSQLQTALRVRHLVVEEAPQPSARRGARVAGADERAQLAPYQRALALAMIGMGAVAALAVWVPGLTREIPEPASARKLYVVSTPQGATITVDAKRLGETPSQIFADPEARRLRLEKNGYRAVDFNLREGQEDIRMTMEPLAAEAKQVARARVATKKLAATRLAANKLAAKKPRPTVLASPDTPTSPADGREPGGLFVVVGRGFDTVGDGVGRAVRDWLTPAKSPQ
jgi:predicted Ser/Thr protein kinase